MPELPTDRPPQRVGAHVRADESLQRPPRYPGGAAASRYVKTVGLSQQTPTCFNLIS